MSGGRPPFPRQIGQQYALRRFLVREEILMKRKIARFKAIFDGKKPSEKALPKITVTLFIKPILYEDSEVFSAVELVSAAERKRKDALQFYEEPLYARAIKGSPFDPAEELEFPIRCAYERFLEDCEFIGKNTGFQILDRRQTVGSKKAECRFTLGVGHTPCGTFVFAFCVSERALAAYKLPKAWKLAVSACLEMDKILSDDFRKYRMNLAPDKIVVGRATYASWDQALDALWERFAWLKRKAKKRLKRQT